MALLPLLFLLYVIAYLDRANVAFAKLKMQHDLDFSDAVFGLGFGLFFVGYMFLEIPGALLVEHWSARKWFARILVTWGFCSMGMALVETPTQFYVARFLLGLAEAGFFPGVIVYFTHWFPKKDRARAMSVMLLGVPLSLAFGARLSAMLLEQNWFDLKGWQWVFLIEGRAGRAARVGGAVPAHRPPAPGDVAHPGRARVARIDAGRGAATRPPRSAPFRSGRRSAMRNVWLLALALLATNMGGYVFVFWLATVVKGLLGAAGRGADATSVLNWTGFVFLCGVARGGRVGLVVRPHRRPQVAQRRGAGRGRTVPRAGAGPGSAVGSGVRVAVPDRVLRDVLVHPVLGRCRR